MRPRALTARQRCELAAERRGVRGAQIDLILGAIDPEAHRLGCRAPIKIIFESGGWPVPDVRRRQASAERR
jgi:hypothetical protein